MSQHLKLSQSLLLHAWGTQYNYLASSDVMFMMLLTNLSPSRSIECRPTLNWRPVRHMGVYSRAIGNLVSLFLKVPKLFSPPPASIRERPLNYQERPEFFLRVRIFFRTLLSLGQDFFSIKPEPRNFVMF